MVCLLFSWTCSTPTYYLCFHIFFFSSFGRRKFLSTLSILLPYCWIYNDACGFSEYANRATTLVPSEELLFVFPAISLMSSPSKSIKGAATELLSILEKLLVTLLVTTKDEVEERGFHFPMITTPGSIIVKLLEKLWFQVNFCNLTSLVFYFILFLCLTWNGCLKPQRWNSYLKWWLAFDKIQTILFQGLSSLSSGFFLDSALYGQSNSKDDNDFPKKCWTSKLREYSLWIIDRRKSLLPLTQFEELFVTGNRKLLFLWLLTMS